MKAFNKRPHGQHQTFFLMLVILLLASCGAAPDERSSADARGTYGRDRAVTPPKAYYDALLADRMELASSGALGNQSMQTLWLNFNGATVKQGYGRSESFLPCTSKAKIPASGLSSSDQLDVARSVAQFFADAGVRLAITIDQPSTGDYTTMHIGGSYASLGCPGGGSVAGIAPFDPSNANPNDVGFVFVRSKDLNTLARTIAHESAHSFGLDHTDNKLDLMYPTDSALQTAFTVGNTADGSSQDGPALLQTALGSGSATVSGNPVASVTQPPVIKPPLQNQVKAFPNIPGSLPALPGLGNLGGLSTIVNGLPATINVALSCVLPAVINGAIPMAVQLPNSSTALSALTVLQAATMAQNNGTMNMLNLIGLVSGVPNVNQILTIAGIVINASQCLGQITPISIPGITATMPGQLSTSVNVAQILGMQTITNPSQLIALLPQYAQVIAANGQSVNTQALMSLVMMAVAQQYQGISFPTP
jgi:hypothetical protein